MASGDHPWLEAWLHPDVAAAATTGGGRLPDPISAALPVFFALIAAEAAVSWRRRGPPLYSLRQTCSNLAAGTLSVLLGAPALRALGCRALGWRGSGGSFARMAVL